jgi:hypothetical protein
MWIRSVTAAASGLAVVLTAASCSNPITQPIINSARLVGTWTGPKGAVVTFSADQSVTVRNIDLSIGGLIHGCGNLSATGLWQFDSIQGDSGPTPHTYSKSNIIQVDFLGSADRCDTQFTTWKDHPPTMCQDLDPDSPCSEPRFDETRMTAIHGPGGVRL